MEYPADEALELITDYLEEQEKEIYKDQLTWYFSSLGLYSQGAKIPDPPQPPLRYREKNSVTNKRLKTVDEVWASL